MSLKKIAANLLPRILKHIPRNQKWLYPFFLAGSWQISEEVVIFCQLPESLIDLRIAYASDIHYGPYFNQENAMLLFSQIIQMKPNLVILGGDYGDVLENSISFFQSIPSFPKEIPVFAAIGNHDYGKKGQPMEPLYQLMLSKHIMPLVNQTKILQFNDIKLAICMPDDVLCGKPDYHILKKESAAANFIIFAPHSPDAIPDAESAGFQYDWALCGHTHGGQLVLFGRSIHSSSRYGDRYRLGWYKENEALIHVSSGVGTSILPIRIGTKASIHLFTLKREL